MLPGISETKDKAAPGDSSQPGWRARLQCFFVSLTWGRVQAGMFMAFFLAYAMTF